MAREKSKMGKGHDETKRLTVILGIAPNPESTSLDVWETQSDGLAQRGRIDMRDVVKIADAAVRIVKALSGDIAVGVRSVICSEPGAKKVSDSA